MIACHTWPKPQQRRNPSGEPAGSWQQHARDLLEKQELAQHVKAWYDIMILQGTQEGTANFFTFWTPVPMPAKRLRIRWLDKEVYRTSAAMGPCQSWDAKPSS